MATLSGSNAQVWIVGATGLVGANLLNDLLDHPSVAGVTALVRRPIDHQHPKLRVEVLNFDRLEASLTGQTATHVFCCLGTTIGAAGSQEAFRRVDYDYPLALGRAAKASNAGRFLVISAMGANSTSRIFYNRVKGDMERDLAALALPALDVFRPSLLLGKRSDKRTGERLAALLAAPMNALLLGPLRKYRPIEAADVARAMIAIAFDASPPTGPVVVHESDRIAAIARTKAR